MSRSKPFYSYLNTCFDRLKEGLENFAHWGDIEWLFRARVSIKKIRCCLGCIEYRYGKKHFRKTEKDIKKIFKSVGMLRDLQLHKAWLVKHRLMRFGNFINLNEVIRKKYNQFMSSREKAAVVIKESKKNIRQHGGGLAQSDVFDYYVLLLKDSLPLLSGVRPCAEWHEMRKQVKLVLYARHWQIGNGLRILSGRQAMFLDRLQHLIGDWHDTLVMIDWFKSKEAEYAKCGSESSRKMFFNSVERVNRLLEEERKKHETRVFDKLNRLSNVIQPLSLRLKREK